MIIPICISNSQDLAVIAAALQNICAITLLDNANCDHANKAISHVLSAITPAPTKDTQSIESVTKQVEDFQDGTNQELNADQVLRQKCMELSSICHDINVGFKEDITIKFANEMYNYILSNDLPDSNKELRLKSMEIAVQCRSTPFSFRNNATIQFAKEIYNYIASGGTPNVIKA